jgi:NAD(P)-dependent dehydrogenase (short-subunit alcohol dehydrogenase family)
MTSPVAGGVVLVTGANGGLGTEFVRQPVERGATKVYATARTPRAWDDHRVVPLALDITSPDAITEAATQVLAAPEPHQLTVVGEPGERDPGDRGIPHDPLSVLVVGGHVPEEPAAGEPPGDPLVTRPIMKLRATGRQAVSTKVRKGVSEPPVGIEPTTFSLRVRRSTD